MALTWIVIVVAAIVARLFQSGREIALEKKNHSRIAAAKNALRTSLTLSFEKTHFVTNRKTFVIGVVISATAPGSSSGSGGGGSSGGGGGGGGGW